MDVLKIHLLGPPTVEWQEAPWSIPRRQTRLLLFRLAVRGRPLAREHLLFLLWPEFSQAAAGRNLSHLLTHLRHALPVGDVVFRVDDSICLDGARVWCDVEEFLYVGDRVDRSRDLMALEQAARLYRGPFLEGISFSHCPEYESWALGERRFLEECYCEVLLALIEQFTQAGEVDRAVRYAHRYLAVECFDEAVHRRLIELYAARGDRAAALRQYRQCAGLLERELGVLPLPATEALVQAVRRGCIVSAS